MTLDAVAGIADDAVLADLADNSGLIAQPERPTLPMRVPVVADCDGVLLNAEVLGSTENVLLLQGSDATSLPPLGTPIRLQVEWDLQSLTGRIAAHGVAGRYLVTIGERAIRRSKRFPVDLPGIARSAHWQGPVEVRVTDLSAGGARVEGIDLPIGSDLDLQFTPPRKTVRIDVRGFVVRAIDGAGSPTVGVAFRLVEPSMDVLAST
jgi:hypothetical protein